jgi:very-short-patch-repair endonuclease
MRRRDADRTIATIAARQHGVVARSQLLAAGVGPDQVDRRVQAGQLRPQHRGVYLAGPVEAPLARVMSAVLSCGASAVLSHRSAGMLWGLLQDTAEAEPVDVIIAPRARRLRSGVRMHRVELQRDEVTRRERIPVTTAARTLYDVARHMAGRDLERMVAEALAQRLTTRSALERLVRRYERRPASARLGELLGSRSKPALTRSAAEEALLSLITKAQLPRPDVNVRVAGFEVDFYWRGARLVVEMDGFGFHSTRGRFETDRRRDAELLAKGLRVMRVTWQQIEQEREAVLVRLAQALAANSRRSRGTTDNTGTFATD